MSKNIIGKKIAKTFDRHWMFSDNRSLLMGKWDSGTQSNTTGA